MARAVAESIDRDPERLGLARARTTCERWLREYGPDPNVEEWRGIISRSWEEIRRTLLDESERGARLRQNSPFAGVLPPRQRWDIYRKFRDDSTAT